MSDDAFRLRSRLSAEGVPHWYYILRIAQILGEHLVSIRLQMGASSTNKELVTLTKQTKIDQCEQVRVN
jgi:hypothetical protein